jgi:hypothetical protein
MINTLTEWQKQKLKGNVKSLKLYNNKKITLYTIEELKEYERKGQKPPTSRYVLDEVYEFNPQGYVTSKKYILVDDVYHTIYQYNDLNNYESQTLYIDNAVHSTYTFTYDSFNLPAQSQKVDKDGNLIFKETNTFKLSADSIVQICLHTNIETQDIEKYTVVYYPNKIMKSLLTEFNNQPRQKICFNEKGDAISFIYYKNGVISKRIRIVKKDNSTLMFTSENQGTEYLSEIQVKNAQGDVTQIQKYNKAGEQISMEAYSYGYDKYGNWVIKQPLNAPSYITTQKREITYY